MAALADGSAVVIGKYVGNVTFGGYTVSGLAKTGAFFAKIGADASFVQVAGVGAPGWLKPRIARYNADGTLDQGFNTVGNNPPLVNG